MGLIDRDKDWNIHFLRDLNVFGYAIVVGSSVAAGALKWREKKKDKPVGENLAVNHASRLNFYREKNFITLQSPEKNYALLKF